MKKQPRGTSSGVSVKIAPKVYWELRQLAKKTHRTISGQLAFLIDYYTRDWEYMSKR